MRHKKEFSDRNEYEYEESGYDQDGYDQDENMEEYYVALSTERNFKKLFVIICFVATATSIFLFNSERLQSQAQLFLLCAVAGGITFFALSKYFETYRRFQIASIILLAAWGAWAGVTYIENAKTERAKEYAIAAQQKEEAKQKEMAERREKYKKEKQQALAAQQKIEDENKRPDWMPNVFKPFGTPLLPISKKELKLCKSNTLSHLRSKLAYPDSLDVVKWNGITKYHNDEGEIIFSVKLTFLATNHHGNPEETFIRAYLNKNCNVISWV